MKNEQLRFVLVLIFTFVLSITGKSWANERYESTYSIRATPFDGKLASVGFFEKSIVADKQPANAQSVESLFQIARAFRYVPHGPDDQWQSTEETAAKGSGNCADKAVWLYTQLKQNGYDNVRIAIGKYRSIDSIFHVWVTYMDESGISYILDPTIQRRPWKIMDFYQNFYRPLYSFGDGIRYRTVSY